MGWTQRKILLAGLVIALLLGGLYLSYDASKNDHSRYDVRITQNVQDWNAPGLDPFLDFVSEFTNFYPGIAIWASIFVLFFWRGLRIEAFALLLAVVTFFGAEALSVLVDRPRPTPDQGIEVSKFLAGNSFPSGHVFAAVVFYGLLVGVAWHRFRWLYVRVLLLAIAASIVGLAGVSRVYLGVHWPSDVLGGLLLGSVALAGLLWVYAGLRSGYLGILGLEFRVTERRNR